MGIEIDLGGRVAIVTDGGRGIGRAVALGLARPAPTFASPPRSVDELEELSA